MRLQDGQGYRQSQPETESLAQFPQKINRMFQTAYSASALEHNTKRREIPPNMFFGVPLLEEGGQ